MTVSLDEMRGEIARGLARIDENIARYGSSAIYDRQHVVFRAILDHLSNTTADAVIEAARKFRDEVSDIRSGIFYWMTRNHNRGERSYAELGQAKERLTAAIKSYDDMLAAHDRAQGKRG